MKKTTIKSIIDSLRSEFDNPKTSGVRLREIIETMKDLSTIDNLFKDSYEEILNDIDI